MPPDALEGDKDRLLAELARQEGLFDWVAARATRLARGSGTRLFTLVYAVGTAVTALLSNDATAVVLTPAVAAAARAARAEQPLPYPSVALPDLGPMSIPSSRLVGELFELPNVVTSPSLQQLMQKDELTSASLTAEDWLCEPCLRKVALALLWIWWWNEKAHGRVIGQTLQTDCWCVYYFPCTNLSLTQTQVWLRVQDTGA